MSEPKEEEAAVLQGQRGSGMEPPRLPSAKLMHTRRDSLCPAESAPAPVRLGKPKSLQSSYRKRKLRGNSDESPFSEPRSPKLWLSVLTILLGEVKGEGEKAEG